MPSASEALRVQARRAARRSVRGRPVVLFGASVLAAHVKDELERRGVTVEAVIDNDADKVGRDYHGVTVQRPEDVLVPYREDCVVIVVGFIAAREMLYELESLGYRRRRQAFVLSPYGLDESVTSFARVIPGILKGLLAYRRMAGRDRRSTVFVAPYAGTGDVYLICLYLRSFAAREGIREHTLVVASGACAQVARMMGETEVVVADPATINAIVAYGRFARAAPHQIVVLNDGWSAAPAEWLRGFRGLDFDKMFRHAVFGLSDDVAAEHLVPSATNDEVLALFDEQGLVPGRTAVLSPYANTLFRVPDEDFWGAVAAQCAEQGLTVCTNCAPGEEPIAGTVAARFPLSLAPDFVETAGYLVAVRSGFCDVVSATASRKVVLYDREGRFYKGSFHGYFSLDAMGLAHNLVEMEYGRDASERLVDGVMRSLA